VTISTTQTDIELPIRYSLQLVLDKNPIPYKRSTQASTWTPEYKKYTAWKQFLQEAFIRRYPQKGWLPKTKPITSEGPWFCSVRITFKGHNHGDPDNILKGVNDSLFCNDKYTACAVDFKYGKIPLLEIQISPHKIEGF